MACRIRNFAALFCVVACIALTALWVRSYWTADRLHGRIWFPQSFLIASKQGRLVAVALRWHGAENWWRWDMMSYPVDDELSFPVGDARQYDAALGFGLHRQPAFMVTRSTFETPAGGTIYISGAASATLQGWSVSVPFWFVVLSTAAAGVALRSERPWRFSIRSLFIAVTVIAIVLGLVVALDKPPQNWELDEPVPLDDL